MKILKIEFENLNSLRGVQTIDLESGDLAEAGIFAITGPTGAGKSTILDAITLALYGRAARYGSSPSPEDMMSRHTGFCRSEIVFETPTGRFRSAWLLNRARKNPNGKIQPAKHQVFDQDETPLTQKIKETASKIQELIGLDFDRFLRSVLLAQGEFAKFLKSDVNERSRLLESLTGTGIYSNLSQLVFEQHKEREGQLKQREAKLDAVVLLSQEELKEKQSQHKKLSANLESLKKKLKATRDLVGLGDQRREATEAKKKLAAQLKSLEEHGKAHAASEQRLKLHRRAFAFKPDLGRLDQQRTQCTEADKLVRGAVTQTEASGQTLRLALQQATTWFTDHNNRLQESLDDESKQQVALTKKRTQVIDWLAANAADEALAETIPNLRTGLEKLKSGWRTGAEATAHLKKLAVAAKKAEGSIKQTKKELETAEAAIKKSQDALDKQQDLLVKELDGADPKNLNDQRDRLTQKIASLTTMIGQQVEADELKLAIERKEAALEKQRHDYQQQESLLSQADKAVESQEEICSALEVAVEQARLVAELTDHRANLKDGEACPLCGSLEHPAIDDEPTSSLATLQSRFNEARGKSKKLATNLQALSQQMTLAKGALKSKTEEVKNDRERLAKYENSLAKDASKFNLSADESKNLVATKTAVEAELGHFKQRMSKIDQLREAVQMHQQTTQTSLSKRDLLVQSLESNETKLADLFSEQQEVTERSEATNIDVLNQTNLLDQLLKPFGLKTPDSDTIENFQQTLDERSVAFQRQTKQLTDLESSLTDSKRTFERLQKDKLSIAEGQNRIEIWTKEDALPRVSPTVESKEQDVDWATVADLSDHLGTVRATWQQAVNREQDRKDSASEIRKAFTMATATLLTKVVQGGFENVEQLQANLLSDEVAEQIANDLAGHKEQLDKTQGQLEQLEKTLTALKEKSAPDTQQLADLVAKLEQDETDANQQQKELTTIENSLNADQLQRQKQEQAHKELQNQRQELATWQRLNEIMGSADGKKFRTFAQGISLDLVIRHANQHLTELSKRYRLQRRAADSLGLEICDLHQANAMRPMESLSGGESFVVSLALALGLSDLAGQSVRIDSLFIDEGFGTLDPETLDMAVAALERLQARNKTIGVISHVELLKERITTQIQVQPKAGGISELKIVA